MRKDIHGLQISFVNEAARRGGLRQDMRLSDARSILPSLITQLCDPDADAVVLRKLADWCQRYTPIVSLDGADGLWLDVTGAAHLCGGECGLLADLSKRLQALGFENQLGLAETAGAAWAIARYSMTDRLEKRVMAPHCVADDLQHFPIQALRLEEGALYLLKRFGFKTIGELCNLPRASLKRRFPSKEIGEAVLYRLDQAFGRAEDTLVPLRPAPAYCEYLSCPEPLLETESFYRGLDDLLVRLCKRMEKDLKGAKALTYSAYHADGGVSRVFIATAQPSRSVDHLAHLFRDQVETLNPGFGVDHLVLSADVVERLSAQQLGLSKRFTKQRDHGAVFQLIDRLSNRLGPRHVQRVNFRESHVPEHAERRVSALQIKGPDSQETCVKPPRPLRLLHRPELVRVIAEIPEGPPVRFTWRRVTHRVICAEGPERIAPEWWLLSRRLRCQRTRDYYRVETDKGQRFWIFREGLYRDASSEQPPSWHMHGLFA